MKRIAVIGLVAVMVFAASLTASAQGLMGFAQGVQSYIPGAGIFGRYLGGCDQGTPGIWTPTIFAGYVTHREGVNLHSDYYHENYLEDISIPLRGLWLGAAINLLGCDPLGFTIGGGALVPWNPRAHDETWAVVSEVGYTPRLHNQWSIVGALATYRLYGGFKVLGGFRWDQFVTKLQYREGLGSGDSYYTMNAYLPLVGVQTQYGGPCTNASAGIIGFPVVPGNFKYEFNSSVNGLYHEFSSQFWIRGYFLECFLRFNQRFCRTAALGAFATFSVLHTVTGHGSYGYDEPPDNTGRDGLQYVFHRQAWTLGGSVSIDFFTL